jgi:hypothetical protein
MLKRRKKYEKRIEINQEIIIFYKKKEKETIMIDNCAFGVCCRE